MNHSLWTPCLAALFAVAGTTFAFGQSVLAPPPVEFSEMVPSHTGEAKATTRAAAARTPSENDPLFRWGPVQVRPHLNYRFSYGDGVPAGPGEDYDTAIHEIMPGVLFQLGDRWYLDYTPTVRIYSDDQFNDRTDHSVRFGGGTTYEAWTFGLSQTYASASDPLAETAQQTERDSFVTGISAARELSSELSLQLGANQSFEFRDDFTDALTWSTMNWLDYQFHPDFAAAVGAGFGYTDVNPGYEMTFEQLQGRITWQAGEKLGLIFHGGFDFRQFLDIDSPNLANPIYGLSMIYELFEVTTLSLNGDRSVNASLYENRLTESSRIGLGLRQRLLEKLYLSLNGGFSFTSYIDLTPDQPVDREDDGTFFTARLSTTFAKKATAAIFYHINDNSSDSTGYSTTSQQVGFELGYSW